MANVTETMTSDQLRDYYAGKGRKLSQDNSPASAEPKTVQRKYRNNRTPLVIDGVEVMFDSRAEARYFVQLQMRQKIEGFRIDRQVSILCKVNGHLVCRVVVDFRITYPDGRSIWYDVKGKINGMDDAWKKFRFKQKLVKALFDIDIIVISVNKRNAD